MKKNFTTRSEQEQKEGLPVVDNSAPDARFQTEQQVNDAEKSENVQGASSSFNKKKVNTKGSVLKTEVASTVVEKGLGGAVPEAATSVRMLAYSGNEGTILGSAAYTPSAGQSRANDRLGKKLDATAKQINYVASEIVEQDSEGSKPLAQSPDRVQGYNGTIRNSNLKSQKTAGGTPADLMFQRSLDEISRDHCYFAEGQMIKEGGVAYNDTPTKTVGKDKSGAYGYNKSYNLVKGNFLHRALKVHFSSTGVVDSFSFDLIDLSINDANHDVVNASATHALVDMNQAEIDRQIMDHKAGDEKAEVWTPLARAIYEPTQTVGMLRDLEAITGAEVYTAYKKTAIAYAYNLNRSAKDGLKLRAPMVEALAGCVIPEVTSSYSSFTNEQLYSKDFLKYGPAALFYIINDSADNRINTKADMLLSQKGVKLALQIADNNMNPLRVKKLFADTIDHIEVFSTIDREYDPLQPVCISDKVGLIHCYDFNQLYSFTSLKDDGQPLFKNDPFKYMYSDLRNNYIVTCAMPLLAGIHRFLNQYGSKFRKYIGDATLTIPMVHSTKFFSLWSLIVLASTPYICQERVNSMRDVLYYEKNVEYPFSQLVSIESHNPTGYTGNFDVTDFTAPLVIHRMQPSQVITWVMPELFWPFDELTSNNRCAYVLPLYFNESSFIFSADKAPSLSQSSHDISFPEVRSGARFGYLDDLLSMDERDVRLCLDRLTDIPTLVDKAEQGVYKYGVNNDGLVAATIDGSEYTYKKFLSLPRELGLFIVAPYGLLSPLATPDDWRIKEETNYPHVGVYSKENDPVLGQTSYLAKRWHGRTSISYTTGAGNTILNADQVLVNRSTAYVQDWDAIPATIGYNQHYGNAGFCMSLAETVDGTRSIIKDQGYFIPFTDGISNKSIGTDEYALVSYHKAMWTRIQLLPFVISPWDCVARIPATGSEDGIHYDIFDFAYCFGLCGFRASNYDEDLYNRASRVLDQGFTYLSDPFIEDTPLLK